MKPGHYRYAVYGHTHPAFDRVLLGRYRWRWVASFAAWRFRTFRGATLWPDAWVCDEEVIVTL